MREQVAKIETKTVKGVEQWRCRKGEFKAAGLENWFMHSGATLPYLTLCREHEKIRSNEWHQQARDKAKAAATTTKPKAKTSAKSTARKSTAKTSAKSTAKSGAKRSRTKAPLKGKTNFADITAS